MEDQLIEEEVSKRVEKLVAERVAEQLESRSEEIELEVLKRVEAAKKILEKEMLSELQRKKEKELQLQQQKEVFYLHPDFSSQYLSLWEQRVWWTFCFSC